MVLSFLISLGAFLVAIGILVAVHEFGHFWVAKKLNIKVLRFSIGFGKILKSWQWGETQFTLCVVPLGGFVKMLDENEASVSESEKHRAFNRQTVYKRLAVVLAGPAANFIFAIVLYTGIFILGTTGIKPMIGSIEAGSIAAHSGLQIGDNLLAINQQKTQTIAEFSVQFLQNSDQPTLTILTQNAASDAPPKTHTLSLTPNFLHHPEQGIRHYLGFKFALPKLEAVLAKVLKNSPAERAGLQPKDKILSANHKPVRTWNALTKIIQNNPNKTIRLQVERIQNTRPITLEMWLTPELKNQKGRAGVFVFVPKNYAKTWQVVVQKNPLDALLSAHQKVYQLSVFNLKMMQKMLFGEVSLKQISGPISIANYAGQTAQIGLLQFLSFLALISIGLGLINLLPIPLLDGGHAFLYLLEMLTGSPITPALQQILSVAGLLIILLLTSIALYNDLSQFL